MEDGKTHNYIKDILKNVPKDWINLTTHRLDIYDESQAKNQFLAQFEALFEKDVCDTASLGNLPTAFDYIRLGHPLSCILEWYIGKQMNLSSNNIICFSSKTMPLLAVLRKNALEGRTTQINFTGKLPQVLDFESLKAVYGYRFELNRVSSSADVKKSLSSSVFISQNESIPFNELNENIDFLIHIDEDLGSIIMVNDQNEEYISEIQHVRRRETIAMTPANALVALKKVSGEHERKEIASKKKENKASVLNSIKEITSTTCTPIIASSGLSIQYALLMGLINDAVEKHPGKAIKIIVPPNCYGGTNDQARRVATAVSGVEVLDLPVDDGNDMVKSVDAVLQNIAAEDAIPYIIAEIPTNPRVEVPDLIMLQKALGKKRVTKNGDNAISPVFILDQTFCPNINFLGEGAVLSNVRAISYASGSKFPSGGRCTAGYCVANVNASPLMKKIEHHLHICDNEATALQYEILAKQLPSMNQRISDAYANTREFVNYIKETLPEAKINFVSEALAKKGFTPSVFSLDLPTKGETDEERENYKRRLNLKLINLMIKNIPNESKYCVSYGQLKGCYWTIPATSTQGTTKEGDKDYIARVALSPTMNLELHKKVFFEFVESI
jgi:cystathionine beta-lyase/cystathionine gamma-synthase